MRLIIFILLFTKCYVDSQLVSGLLGNLLGLQNDATVPTTFADTDPPVEEITETTTTMRPRPTPPKCSTSKTIINGRSGCSGRIIFNEKFPNNFLTMNRKWDVEVKFADAPDYEFVFYTNDKKVIYTNRNVLYIKPVLTDDKYGTGFIDSRQEIDLGENCTGSQEKNECSVSPSGYIIVPPVLSAKINTRNYFNFRYGIITVRAKLPEGDWIYPEIFLNPKDSSYGPGYESGQIRIAFIKGNMEDTQTLFGGCILSESSTGRSYAMKKFLKDDVKWSDDFHIFTVRWAPDSITLLVDEEEYGKITPEKNGFSSLETKLNQIAARKWKSGSPFAPFDKDMYISIGVGVGGHNFYDSDNKPWQHKSPKEQKQFYRAKDQWYSTWNQNSVLEVDYVRVTSL